MPSRAALVEVVSRAAWPVGCAAAIGWSVFHAMAGTSGMIAWRGYAAESRDLGTRAARVATQRAALEHQSLLLDPRHVDPDFADELVRRNLGVVGPDEVVVALPAVD